MTLMINGPCPYFLKGMDAFCALLTLWKCRRELAIKWDLPIISLAAKIMSLAGETAKLYVLEVVYYAITPLFISVQTFSKGHLQ